MVLKILKLANWLLNRKHKKPPSERFLIYIKDFKNWTLFENDQTYGYYYDKFPEFVVEKSYFKDVERYESWMPVVTPDNPVRGESGHFILKYNNTVIKSIEVFSSDDNNYLVCYPERDFPKNLNIAHHESKTKYFFEIESIEFYLSLLFHNKNPRRNIYDFRRLIEIRWF